MDEIKMFEDVASAEKWGYSKQTQVLLEYIKTLEVNIDEFEEFLDEVIHKNSSYRKVHHAVGAEYGDQ